MGTLFPQSEAGRNTVARILAGQSDPTRQPLEDFPEDLPGHAVMAGNLTLGR